ncbi:MAG: UDP-N-acetylmuramoyl-L-alanine--D-glutamate ligase [Pseudomonadota bacterium]
MNIQKQSTYLILGLARSGKATAAFFGRIGESYVVYDDQAICYEGRDVLSAIIDIPWETIKAVIQSPGIPFFKPQPHPVTAAAIVKGIPVMTDIDLFNQYRDGSIACVGITGTNGKSTTTALVTHILNMAGKKAVMGGNIGVPVLSLLDERDVSVHVLELSSFQLEVTNRIDLDIAVLTNVSEDHIDRHGSMDAYSAAKDRIFNHAKCRVIGAECVEPVDDLSGIERLPGVHNEENMRVAYAVCTKLGVAHDLIVKGFNSFLGLAHRMELVYTCSDFCIINDSKATNADSTERALVHYTQLAPLPYIYWIAGGKPKAGGIQSLKPYFSMIRKAYFIGAAQEEFLATTEGSIDAKTCGDLETAVCAAFADMRNEVRAHGYDPLRHYLILFSPACASYDQFRDFEHRGDEFKRLALNSLKSRTHQ